MYRLRASMKEFLGELPPEVERLFAEVREPDAKAAPRAFVPTRPTVLRKGEARRESPPWFRERDRWPRVTLFTRAEGLGQVESFAHEIGRAGELISARLNGRREGLCWIITFRLR